MIRAAVVDLDGTLIGRDGKISAEVAHAVSRLSSQIPVCIATGREPADTLKFARQLGLTAAQICDGGATILDPASGQTLWTSPLRADVAEEIINTLHGRGTAFIATQPGGSLTNISQITHWNLTRVSALDLEEPAADALVSLFSANRDLHAVKVVLPYNNLWAVDFTHFGVDKAAATLELSRMVGVDTGSVVAAGDSYNDMPLLQLCGLGIAMGNAPDELKAIADYVAPPVEEDGLAVAIEQFVLPRL